MSEINELKDLVAEFIKERDWNKFHNPKNISMSIAIEAGELMEIFQWYTNEECNSDFIEKNRKEIEDEVADVLIYTLSLANVCNLDLKRIITSKMERNYLRFPVERVKGKLG